MDTIDESGDLNDDISAGLKSAVEEFKSSQTW
jgi:hypothetical protein